MGTLRGKLVPEAARSTIMNLFRIPLNAIVVLILLQDFELTLIFKFCVAFLLLSTLCMFRLHKLCSVKAPEIFQIQKRPDYTDEKDEVKLELVTSDE